MPDDDDLHSAPRRQQAALNTDVEAVLRGTTGAAHEEALLRELVERWGAIEFAAVLGRVLTHDQVRCITKALMPDRALEVELERDRSHQLEWLQSTLAEAEAVAESAVAAKDHELQVARGALADAQSKLDDARRALHASKAALLRESQRAAALEDAVEAARRPSERRSEETKAAAEATPAAAGDAVDIEAGMAAFEARVAALNSQI